jgi:hypothetical protein
MRRYNIDLGSTSQSCQIYFQWLCNQYILLLLNPIIIVYIKLMMCHINQTLYLTIHSFSNVSERLNMVQLVFNNDIFFIWVIVNVGFHGDHVMLNLNREIQGRIHSFKLLWQNIKYWPSILGLNQENNVWSHVIFWKIAV